MSLKLISLNIETDRHLDKIIPFLKSEKPDVVCFQEVFSVNLPLFKKLGFNVCFTPIVKFTQPNRSGFSLLGNSGLAILNNQPFDSIQSQYYGYPDNRIPEHNDIPWIDNHALLWVKVNKDSQSYTIANTHFIWAMPETGDKFQAQPLQRLLKILQTIPDFVLAGDLNAPRGKKTWVTLASLYQDNIPQTIVSTLDPKLHRAGPLNWVVDGLFSTPHYQIKNVQVKCGISDHCAVVAQISKFTTNKRPKFIPRRR